MTPEYIEDELNPFDIGEERAASLNDDMLSESSEDDN